MTMPQAMQNLIEKYIAEIQKIYRTHLRKVILFGSYARGDYSPDSDVDIMILLDMSDMDLKAYSQQLSYTLFHNQLPLLSFFIVTAQTPELTCPNCYLLSFALTDSDIHILSIPLLILPKHPPAIPKSPVCGNTLHQSPEVSALP